MKIHSRYKRPDSPEIAEFEPTLAQQQFKDEADINNIMRRALLAGDASIFTPHDRQEFIDTSLFEDYQTALATIETIDEDFFSLPSALRKEFDNDPDKYVRFMSDEANYPKAIELGLLSGPGYEQEISPAKEPGQPAAAPEPPASSEPQTA